MLTNKIGSLDGEQYIVVDTILYLHTLPIDHSLTQVFV